MGLARLDNPELIQQLADLVSNWHGDKHEFLRDLLNECDSDKRYEMYHAIAPKLGFKPLSFPQYEAQIALKAGQMVSQGRMRVEGRRPEPIQVGDHTFMRVPAPLAEGAVATLTCHKCHKTASYFADTPAGAMIEGRKAGWLRQAGINKETCAECAANEAQEEIVVLKGSEKLYVHDRRKVN